MFDSVNSHYYHLSYVRFSDLQKDRKVQNPYALVRDLIMRIHNLYLYRQNFDITTRRNESVARLIYYKTVHNVTISEY